MNPLLPGRKRFTSTDENGKIVSQYSSNTLDTKVRVVCKNCNNTWMSKIENEHAKPVMSPLIVGNTQVKINQSQADSIARFAFKTAVLLDYLKRDREPFFTRSIRHGFRKLHAIPATAGMFLAGFAPGGMGHVHTVYHNGTFPANIPIRLHVCTFVAGHLIFQVVSYKQLAPVAIAPSKHAFEHLAVPFWPWIRSGTLWPFANNLETKEDFFPFANRWAKLAATVH
jgi:hypothetical protein